MKNNRNNITELVFILDRSGSMAGLESDTIGGFNAMIEKQKKEEGECYISTVLFDNVSEVLHDRVKLSVIKPMTDKEYTVRGCTALIDAIGGAIHHIGNIHKYARPEDVPENTIEAFESKIVEVIAIAYVQAMDDGIVNGSGNGSMLGILNDPRVAATSQVVTMTAAQIKDWSAWRKNFFAKLPLGYRDGEFIFAMSTVDAYLETMADANNNPIFRQATGLEVNDGDAANPNGRFFGRSIALVEPDILPDFDTANSNDVIGIFWQPQEYAINENFGFTMRRYYDEEANEWVDKALVVVDGKVLNPNGIWLIKKA